MSALIAGSQVEEALRRFGSLRNKWLKVMRLVWVWSTLSLMAACYPSEEYVYFQKLTLSVETPHGEVTASAVMKFTHDYYPKAMFASGTERITKIEGEAVVADLGGGRYLFALLPDESPIAYRAFDDLRTQWTGSLLKALSNHAGQPPRAVPNRYRPQLVTFSDIADPASVVAVDPDNLAAVFGEGYALQEVTVQIVDEPVTQGVVSRAWGYVNWSLKQKKNYACRVHECYRSPIRISNANGTTTVLTIYDFVKHLNEK